MATGNMHKNLINFGCAVFELCERTDRETGIQTAVTSQPYNGAKSKSRQI